MKVSVIVPLFHGYRYIGRICGMAERNIRAMKEGGWREVSAELIFVDDSPPDMEDSLIDNIIAQEPGLSYKILKHEKNEGIHRSRVDGLNEAEGEYVLFLDQDDTVSDDYLVSQITALEAGDGDWVLCNGIFRSCRLIYGDQEAVENVLSESHYFTCLTEIISPGQAVLKREAVPDSWKRNILRHNYCDDAFLWMLLKDAGRKLLFNDRVAYFHNEDGENASFAWKDNAAALEELKDVMEQKRLLSEGHLHLFRKAVNAEIGKQKAYAALAEKYDIIKRKETIGKLPGKGSGAVIYGYGFWGRKLYGLLHKSIDIRYVVDKNIRGLADGVAVHSLSELEGMDGEGLKGCAVYVAVPCEADGIGRYLRGIGFDNIVGITELFDCLAGEGPCAGA